MTKLELAAETVYDIALALNVTQIGSAAEKCGAIG